MDNKKILMIFILLLTMLPIVIAHAEEAEDTSLVHQFGEVLPFHHFFEGHSFTGMLLIIFWFSFFYAVYRVIYIIIEKKS